MNSGAVTVGAIFRREHGRCVATLIRFLGDIDAAEEAVQDAFTLAVARWPSDGQPPNPGAWIVTTARNRAIDRLRRESVRDERHAQAHHLYGAAAADHALAPEEETVPDERLRLDGYYLFHATRADLLRRLGRDEDAAAAYATARALTTNPVEQAFLDTQRATLSGG
jgi:predicted RNA polymerase sigma factor